LIIEDQFKNKNDSIDNNDTLIAINIIEHGGTIEDLNSSRVTHVICTTQRDCLVEQVI